MTETKLNDLRKVGSMFLQYGIRSVSMDDIAHTLGISKKTLYQHFKDKEELVREAIRLRMLEGKAAWRAIFACRMDAIDELLMVRFKLAELGRLHNRVMEYDLRKYYASIFQELIEDKRNWIYFSVSENLKKGIEEGFYRKDLNIDTIARLHVGLMMNVLNEGSAVFNPGAMHSIELFDEVLRYHVYGICTAVGRETFISRINKLEDHV